MKEISPDELKVIATRILEYIDDVCNRYNLRYFLMFGTLIGAIRHKGFIPWDDDIDICLPRKDYEELMRIVEKEGRYNAICMENDPDYYFTYGRITDKATILKHRPKRKIRNFGIFVDVFPVDNAPSVSDMEEWKREYAEIKSKVWATIPTPYDDFYWGNICHYLVREFFGAKRRLSLGVRNFKKYRDALVECTTRYNGKDSGRYFIAETNGPCCYAKDAFDEYLLVDFENIKARVPVQYDSILRSIFGDYMQMPPVEQRVSGHEFVACWKK